jgi:ribosomal-protein-alanine N-acetyltransferase
MRNQKKGSRSRRVYLRHPDENDFEGLLELYRSSRDHFRGVMRAEFDWAIFDRILSEAQMVSNEYFVICRFTDDAIIGTINLSQIFRRSFQNAYLGYALGAEYTGQGFMTEAVHQVLRFAFDDLKLHRIEANVQPTNRSSIAVLKRSGFTKEGFLRRYIKISGRWRDHERWAIIREDWKRQR